MQRRGQSAGSAAIMVILLATIIVLYILFLPPEDRANLLGENNTDDSGSSSSGSYNHVLLKEKIGRLDYLKYDYREHALPSFRVYSEVVGTELKSISSVYIRNSVSGQKFFNLSFSINERLTDNVFMAFNVKDALGILEIYLNGHEIFNGEIDKGSPTPIKLPKDYLKSENSLSFQVSSTGLAFWRTNRYQLDNLVITGDVIDLSNSETRQYFYLEDAEFNNLKELDLKFYPQCNTREVGPVKIYLNGGDVFSGPIDCGVYNALPLDVSAIVQDRNELEFVVSEGSYLFDRVTVVARLKGLVYPVFYFDLNEDDADFFVNDNKLNETYNISMQIRFTNDDEKRLDYLINGRRRSIRTNSLVYEVNLDDYVLPDTNSIELIPTSTIDIAELKIMIKED